MLHQPIIPQNHTLYGLTFVPSHIVTTGSFISPCGMKLLWHTTEGSGFEKMCKVLRDKGDEPHFVIDMRRRLVAQMVALDQYSRALEHPPHTPETNRAGCIQVEVCGFAANASNWTRAEYNALASLALLIEHRTGIRRIADKAFSMHADRVNPRRWAGAHGHFGHEHAPNQPSGHWDPGAMSIGYLFHEMAHLDS